MRRRNWTATAALALVGATGAAMTPFPAKAVVFVKELEKSSKGSSQVSIWERVVYSLIEARNRGADGSTPRVARSLIWLSAS